MKRIAMTLFTMLALVAIATVALAQNGSAHFIKNASGATLTCPSLNAFFKEAGLASGAVETVQLTATVTAVYACVNGGGNQPSAANKHSITTTVSTSGQFTADQSGNISGTLTLSPPPPPADLCPPGQTPELQSVTYTNVKITDTTSGASISLPGTFRC